MEKKRKIKILRDTRNLLLFILLSASSVWGNDSWAQDVRLTLEMKDVALEQVFERICKLSQFEFIYNTETVDVKETVSVSKQNSTVTEILNEVLGDKYVYLIQDRYIMIRKKEADIPQKQLKIKELKGKVQDVNGQPLPGVTVVIKGSTHGASTDQNGEFKLMTTEGIVPVLRFSFVGMATVEKVWDDKSDVVVMNEDITMLEEATVTTGYQVIDRKRMTGAVETVTAKSIENRGYASVGDVLRGAMAGVSTRNISGKPGARTEIRVRGLNSLHGDMNPIWIVDGTRFYGNLNDLAPEDIQSITVLKDAAAAAIYGAEAANGVIVVTLKRGQNGNASIRINSNFSLNTAPKNKLDMMNAEEKIAFERSLYEDFPNQNSGGRVFNLLKWADVGKISREEAEAEILRLSKINTDWYDVIFRTAFSHNHNLSLSGGSDKTNYYLSLNFQRTEGIIPTNVYTNWGGSIRVSHNFNPKLKISFDLTSKIRKDKDSESSVDPVRYATYANPYERPYDEEGNLEYDRSYASELSTLKDGYKYDFNVLDEMRRNTSTTNSYDNTMTLKFEVKILPGLRFTTMGSVYNSSTNNERILDPGSYANKVRAWVGDAYNELPDELNKGTLSESDGRSMGLSWRNNLEYTKTFQEKHFITLFLGHEVGEYKSWSNYAEFPEYDPEKGLIGVPEVDGWEYMASRIKSLLDVSESQSRNVSFFASASYSFMDRYVVAGSIRMDGADIIGTENRFSPLWNASLKYNLHHENFLKEKDWLNELAFRFSYGYTGSIDKNALPFGVMNFLTTDEYFGENIPTVITPKNPSVKWQKKQDRSFGMDLALWQHRIRATVNYYNNVTRDLLDQRILPISVGVDNIKFNTSSIRNYGWEFSFSTRMGKDDGLSWHASLNMAVNRSKVLESYWKSLEALHFTASSTEPVEGESTLSWIGYRFAGIDPRTGHTLAFVDNSNREIPIGFQREDGNWVLDMDDPNTSDQIIFQNLGNSYPPVSGGFNAGIQWKRLSLDATFSFMARHKIPSAYYASSGGGSVAAAYQNMLRKEASRWRKPGDITDIPGYSTDTWPFLRGNWFDIKLENGNFLKCNSISLSYRLPSKICQLMLLKSMSVNLNMRDVFTLTKYKGLDPENFGGFGYPNSRKYILTVNIDI